MIDLETIEREINELEARGDTTYSMCERLAWLYVVRDHLTPKSAPISGISGSEFLDAVNGVDYHELMQLLDEHMEALRIVYKSEYENVLSKIMKIKNRRA